MNYSHPRAGYAGETAPLELTVLGNGPACPNIEGASSGYLIRANDTYLVLDLGSGVVSTPEFRKVLPRLAGVVISHLHIDHWLDLVPLGYLLKVAPDRPRDTRLKVWTPTGTAPQIEGILETLAMGFPCDVYDVEEYSQEAPLRLPGVQLNFQQVQHYIPSYAMRVEADGASLAYSADTCLCDSLITIAQGCDMLLCEATLGTDDTSPIEGRGHMTAKEAGKVAAEANVGQLLLTHIWDGSDTEAMLRDARAEFSGACQLAERGRSYQVSSGKEADLSNEEPRTAIG